MEKFKSLKDNPNNGPAYPVTIAKKFIDKSWSDKQIKNHYDMIVNKLYDEIKNINYN